MKLSEQRYWHLLLHMVNGKSEIDDEKFFLSPDGKYNAQKELEATLDALLNETQFDDNATGCLFPARRAWLQEELNITDLPKLECREYNKVLTRLNPKSATFVFPAAHINSPASMFGHTFLRINSAYKSKLLSYAVNYAADANTDTENGVVFAIKGLFGGYYGRYSLLPYYEKLKEYRDTEQRDIWEYDLNLNEEEILKMVRHIWELNSVYSNYYFFTENCSYNMLWLLEVARPEVDLKDYFNYQVAPLETIHVTNIEQMISKKSFRPSKRTILLKYEELINKEYLPLVSEIVESDIEVDTLLNNQEISLQQKQYILEASIEYLEYFFIKNNIQKNQYLTLFHQLSKTRASLGKGKKLFIPTPNNPLESHRAIKLGIGAGYRGSEAIGFINLRPVYHDLEDPSFGFLRGTQIEFLNAELSYDKSNKLDIEKLTLLSIVSLAQRSELFKNFSWRTKFGWDKDYLDEKANFISSVGLGLSFGNEFGYSYFMIDPLIYISKDVHVGIGGSFGLIFDKYDFMSTNLELSQRYYSDEEHQHLIELSQSFRLHQNLQLKFKYENKEKLIVDKKEVEQTYRVDLNYYF